MLTYRKQFRNAQVQFNSSGWCVAVNHWNDFGLFMFPRDNRATKGGYAAIFDMEFTGAKAKRRYCDAYGFPIIDKIPQHTL
jgi:hypothetical protein